VQATIICWTKSVEFRLVEIALFCGKFIISGLKNREITSFLRHCGTEISCIIVSSKIHR
jgi:hypothetical protein